MINTHENKMVLPRKAENYVMVSQEEMDQIFPYNKRFCLLLSSLFSGKYLVSLSVNPGASLLAKKKKLPCTRVVCRAQW